MREVIANSWGCATKMPPNILWILGGDRPADGYETLWAALAEGIIEGLGRHPFFTYHPRGGRSSSAWLHDAGWLDMNMWQSGHVLLDAPNWEMIRSDYVRRPSKPVLDGEPVEHRPGDAFLADSPESFTGLGNRRW
jgi:hypothetical protein